MRQIIEAASLWRVWQKRMVQRWGRFVGVLRVWGRPPLSLVLLLLLLFLHWQDGDRGEQIHLRLDAALRVASEDRVLFWKRNRNGTDRWSRKHVQAGGNKKGERDSILTRWVNLEQKGTWEALLKQLLCRLALNCKRLTGPRENILITVRSGLSGSTEKPCALCCLRVACWKMHEACCTVSSPNGFPLCIRFRKKTRSTIFGTESWGHKRRTVNV